MTNLDTNVLLRLVLDDDPAQSRLAATLYERARTTGSVCFVTQIALVEAVWTLRAGYKRTRTELQAFVGTLLQMEGIVLEGSDGVERALRRFASGRGDFSDYLLHEAGRAGGCSETASFDAKLHGEPEFAAPR